MLHLLPMIVPLLFKLSGFFCYFLKKLAPNSYLDLLHNGTVIRVNKHTDALERRRLNQSLQPLPYFRFRPATQSYIDSHSRRHTRILF